MPIRLGATKITVAESRIGINTGLPLGRDIICLMGFFNSDHTLYEIVPVVSIKGLIGDMVPDLSDEVAIRRFKNTSIYQAIVSCRINGGTDIVLCKLGSQEEVDGLSEDAKMDLVYERTAQALTLTAANEWFAYIIPVDAPAEGHFCEYREYQRPTYDIDGTPILDGLGNPVLETVPVPAHFLDFMAMVASGMSQNMIDGIFTQAMLSTASSNGTIWMNSESMRNKERWQKQFCYSDTLGWIPTNDMYRFVAVPTSRALFTSPQYDAFFEAGLAPAVAGLASSLADDVSLAGRTLIVSETIRPVLGSTADRLSEAGFMPVGQTAMMRRRKAEGAVLLGDNTMAVPASDFKQEVVLRLARRVSLKLRVALESVIGTNGLSVGSLVEKTMDKMVDGGTIRGYNYKLSKDPEDRSRIRLYVNVQPYLPVKAIEISIVSGPFVQ